MNNWKDCLLNKLIILYIFMLDYEQNTLHNEAVNSNYQK